VRIGLVCPYSLSLPGGVQGQVLGLARALRALGHPTRVLGPTDGPPPDVGVTALGSSVALAANGSMAPIAPAPASAWRTIAALADEAFDVVHLHEPLVPGPTLTTLVVSDIPLVGTFHAAGASAAYRWAARPLGWAAGRLTLRCAVSDEAAVLARRSLGGSYDVLPNGVEVARFADAEPWPTDGPTVLFLGRHEPRKGLAVLIEALHRLPGDLRLWVAGEGPDTARLRAATTGDPRVCWLGRISDVERSERLRGADVLCAPSLHGESFGVVLLEAMAAGAAVVASDLTGYSAVARADREALLVAPGDAEALARAMTLVLAQPDRATALVEAGEARARELSMDRLAERYLERYAAVAASPPNRRFGGELNVLRAPGEARHPSR
jgi:phosphatidylinositol alpha-mannosyltransferase